MENYLGNEIDSTNCRTVSIVIKSGHGNLTLAAVHNKKCEILL